MENRRLDSVLAVLLVLAAGVCAVSAAQLTVGSLTLANVNDQGDITLTLDSSGLAGYSLTFTIADTSVAQIVSVNYPGWAVPDFRSSSVSEDMKTWTMRVADVAGTSGTTPSLGTVTVKGLKAGGQTTITVTVNEMDDIDGNSLMQSGTIVSGQISVSQAPGDITVKAGPSNPAYGATNAWIYLDGVNTGIKTNNTLQSVSAGVHTVRLNLTGFVDAEKRVNVESGKTVTAEFILDKPATIVVKCNVTGADITVSVVPSNNDIFLNGVPTGKTPATFTGMPPGSWTVRVDAVGYLGKSMTKSVASGATQIFSFTINPANNAIPENTAPYGSIQIDSVGVDNTPLPGATVILDGVPQLDLQTSTTPDVDVGTHSVTVTLEGYVTPAPVQVTVAPHTLVVLQPFVLKPGIPATARIVPRTMNIGKGDGKFLAFVRLPAGYNAADVNPKSVFCDGAPANRLVRTKAFPQVFGAIFSRNKLVDVLPGDSVPFVVSGTIKTKGGDIGFSGIDYIKVIKVPSKVKEDTDDLDKLNDDTIMKNFKPKDL